MPLFIFYTLFAYELWIENWNCDFPFCPFIIAAFFVSSLPLVWSTFCMFGRYRDLIVLSALKDSYDLISIMIKARQKPPSLKPPLISIAEFNFIYICARENLDVIRNL
jgi:hypothetical protein